MTSAARRKKSTKRSGSNRAARTRRHKPLTFYIDENLGRRVARGLREAGHQVVSAIDLHQGVADHVWLPTLAEHDYVLLTKDQHIRRNPLEVGAILNAGIRAFAITADDLSWEDALALLLRRMKKIIRICERRGPYIFNITATGILTEVPASLLRRQAKGAK